MKEVATGIIFRSDLRSGNILMSKDVRTNKTKRIGDVPSVEVGDIFLLRIISSGGYNDEAEDKDVLIYSGQGGNVNKKDKEVVDQKLERETLGWQQFQAWKVGFSFPSGLIIPDLAFGAEKIPVSLVNDFDDERGLAHFTYFPTLKYLKSFKLLQPSFGCNCHNVCRPNDFNCSCMRKNGGDFPYTANWVLVGRKPLVHECGPTCPCFSNCKNKVSQRSLKVHMEVFKMANRDWGLRSWDPIRAGTFICEYAGELIESSKEMHSGNRENCSYIFDTANTYDSSFKGNYDPTLLDEEIPADSNEDYDIPSQLIIYAKTIGNIARFSCSPNVFWQPVLYEHNSEPFFHIAFLAIKPLSPMTELTFDYSRLKPA
ncbi:hypothetical protein LguiB_027079 [Lonicera macranthoides]